MINNPVMNRDGLISTSNTSDLTRMINDQQNQAAITPRDMNLFAQRFDQTAPVGIAPIYNNMQNNNVIQNTAKTFIKNKIANKFSLPKVGNFPMIGPGGMLLGLAQEFLPKEDPVITRSREYMQGLYGLDDIGRIQEGDLMANYNPISGGFLNTITKGRIGEPTKIGLQDAYDKRIKTIKEKGIPRLLKAGKDTSNLLARLKILEDRKASDAKALKIIKDNPNITDRALKLKMTGGNKQVSMGGPAPGSPAAKAARTARSNRASMERGKALHG